MLFTHSKQIIAALLILALTSQSLAAVAMMCERQKSLTISGGNHHPANHNMDVMHHDMSAMNHDMSDMHHHKTYNETIDHSTHKNHHSNVDCCKTLGHCLFSNCSLAMLDNAMALLVVIASSNPEDFYTSSFPSPLISSPYKPPIFS